MLAMNKFSIWGQLGEGEKFWTIFALVLTLSGALKMRAVGLLHAMLMLVDPQVRKAGIRIKYTVNPNGPVLTQ